MLTLEKLSLFLCELGGSVLINEMFLSLKNKAYSFYIKSQYIDEDISHCAVKYDLQAVQQCCLNYSPIFVNS